MNLLIKYLSTALVVVITMFTGDLYSQVQGPTKPPKDIKPVKISEEEYKIGKLSSIPRREKFGSHAE